MKNKLLLLTKINITTVLSPTRAISSGSDSTKSKKFRYAILFAFLIIYFSVLVGAMTKMLYDQLSPLNLKLLIPCIFFIASSFMILITCMFSSHGFLFKAKDLEMLFSFPVSHRDILISKFLMLYFYDLMFSLMIFGVSGAVYAVLDSAGFMVWLSIILGALLTPLLPLTVGVLISYFIGLGLRKFKHRNAITTVLTLTVSLLIILFSSFSQSITNQLVKYGGDILRASTTYYFPAGLLVGAFKGNILSLLLFTLTNIAPVIILFPLMAKHFASIVASYKQTSVKSNYKFRSQKKEKKIDTCFAKEIKRIFSSSVYLLNAGVGILMMVVFTVASFQSKSQLAGFGSGRDILPLVSMFLLLVCSTMNSTTCCTFSLEVKTLWIYKSAPVDEMTVFEAKALANDILYTPFILIFGIIYAVIYKMNAVSIILIIVTPFIALICSSYLGLLINLAFPRMEWQNETQVIKQSKSVLISMLISIGADILVIGLSILALNIFNISIVEIMLCVLVIYLGVMVFLEYLLRTWGVKKFQKLY